MWKLRRVKTAWNSHKGKRSHSLLHKLFKGCHAILFGGALRDIPKQKAAKETRESKQPIATTVVITKRHY